MDEDKTELEISFVSVSPSANNTQQHKELSAMTNDVGEKDIGNVCFHTKWFLSLFALFSECTDLLSYVSCHYIRKRGACNTFNGYCTYTCDQCPCK